MLRKECVLMPTTWNEIAWKTDEMEIEKQFASDRLK